jgi:hypothetical protein
VYIVQTYTITDWSNILHNTHTHTHTHTYVRTFTSECVFRYGLIESRYYIEWSLATCTSKIFGVSDNRFCSALFSVWVVSKLLCTHRHRDLYKSNVNIKYLLKCSHRSRWSERIHAHAYVEQWPDPPPRNRGSYIILNSEYFDRRPKHQSAVCSSFWTIPIRIASTRKIIDAVV